MEYSGIYQVTCATCSELCIVWTCSFGKRMCEQRGLAVPNRRNSVGFPSSWWYHNAEMWTLANLAQQCNLLCAIHEVYVKLIKHQSLGCRENSRVNQFTVWLGGQFWTFPSRILHIKFPKGNYRLQTIAHGSHKNNLIFNCRWLHRSARTNRQAAG